MSLPLALKPKGLFLAAISDATTREIVKSVAAQLGWESVNVLDGGPEAALASIQTNSVPSFLVLDISDAADPIAAVEAIAQVCGAETKVVATGDKNDIGLYRRLLSLGVSDYLVKPVTDAALTDAIRKATHTDHREPGGAKTARIIALVGARGGVGTTTLAVSVAWSIAQKLQVVLLDLDLHFGSASLSLDLASGRGLREILTSPGRIDSLLIDSAMTKVNDRLRVIDSEEPLEDVLDFGNEGLAGLLAELRGATDYIVVDTPRCLNGPSRQILGVADVVAIVADQSLASMRDTQRLLALVKGMRNDARCVVIANRVGGVAGEVGRADFEAGIGAKIAYTISYDMKAAVTSAEMAKAFVEVAHNAKTLSDLRSMALGLMGPEAKPAGSRIERVKAP